MTKIDPFSIRIYAALVSLGALMLWWFAQRTTADRRLHHLVLVSYALRVILGAVLFAISYWQWPMLTSLQLEGGFWLFGVDGRAYHNFGREIAIAWAHGTTLPRMETAIEYFAVVASVYRFLAAHPLYPILVNGWLAAVNGILAYRIAATLIDRRAALLGACLVSFWPSSFIWSAQLLKDTLSWSLIFATLWLVVQAISDTKRSVRAQPVRWAVCMLALAGLLILLTRIRFYLGSAMIVASLAVLLPAGLWGLWQRRFERGMNYVAVAGVVILSVLFARTLDMRKLLAPAHPELGYYRLGLEVWQQGDFLEAAAQFRNAIERAPTFRNAYLGLGSAEVQVQRWEEAIAAYEYYRKDEPPAQQAELDRVLAQVHLEAANHQMRRRTADALQHYHRALMLNPLLVDAPIDLRAAVIDPASAQALVAALQSVEELPVADEESQQSIQQGLAKLYRTMGRELAHLRRNAEAIQAYGEAARLHASSSLLVEYGLFLILVDVDDTPSALALFDRALAAAQSEQERATIARLFQQTYEQFVREQMLREQQFLEDTIYAAQVLFSARASLGGVKHLPRPRPGNTPRVSTVSAMQQQALDTMWETTPEALQVRRDGFVSSGGNSLMDIWAQISTPQKMLVYLPRALLVGLLAPFPWQWFDMGASTGMMRMFAGIDMMLLYGLWPWIIAGLVSIVRQRRAASLFPLVTVLAIAFPIVLVVANYGTLFRLRLLFLLPLFVLATAADPRQVYGWLWRRWLKRAVPVELAVTNGAALRVNGGHKRPTVSVVIPAHNAAATIDAAIHSVLHQTAPAFEIIIIDDGSTDGTAQRVQTFGERVRYLRQEQAGPAAARNRGAAEARGEYVAFLDADDLWLPRKLEAQLAVVEQEPGVEAVQCSAYLVNSALDVLETRRCRPDQDTFLDILLRNNQPAFSSTVMVRKRAFDRLNGFSTDFIMETWDMACRLTRHGTLRSVPEPLVLYRQHAGNRSHDVRSHQDTGFALLGRLFADPTLDPSIRRHRAKIWARFYATLAGSHLHHGAWLASLQWGGRAVITSPAVCGYFAGLPLRQLKRVLLSWRKISFANTLSFTRAPDACEHQNRKESPPCAFSS
ncbi:MAG: hypothetical protein COV75_02235 [Candidatus Omnitrophica bacterium CG11_big_fil_rev_8_21_14_0_20_63_9]|nr:MAG: hypothetical protein COV75_02235 [Candidatus Omnitrophica bacterium CG11_big_fil_rev_8_21_14_0_20_63_9]